MSAPALSKLSARPLDEVAPRLDLPAEAGALLSGQADVPAAIAALAGAGFLVEASRMVAHALPRRESVWWACMCATHTAPPGLGEADARARDLAEEWVRRQTDEVRRAAMAEAERAGFGSPEAWAAVAAFWSGDSMSPLGQPLVPPAPHLAGTAVAGSVALAAVRGDPSRQKARLMRFLEGARDIAAGGTGRLAPEAS